MAILRILFLILLIAGAASADIYKYVDENGTVSYTDNPLNAGAVRIIQSPSHSKPVVHQKQQKNSARAGAGQPDFQSIVQDKAKQYDIAPSLIHAVIKAESNGNPFAVSRKGAKGLMQLMPVTANELNVRNPFNPEDNIDGGTRYLKYLLERFKGDLTLALAAYNAGPKAVEKSGTVPQISETRHYVKRVLSLYNGGIYLPVSYTSVSPASYSIAESHEPIYKVETENGTTLFTNSPQYKKYTKF